jgi:hypothetical protein
MTEPIAPKPPPAYHRVMTIRSLALVTVAFLAAACSAAGASPSPTGPDPSLSLASPSAQPVLSPGASDSATPGPNTLPASITDPVVAEIARVAGVPVDEVVILSAQAETFSDGSLGCPVPGMVYTQALVDGYRIVAKAGGTIYDYRGSGDSFRQCTPAVTPS